MDLLKKFGQFALGNGIVLLLGFISSPIITRIISPIEMGKYSMFSTVTNLLLLITLLGLDQAYVRFYYVEEVSNRGLLLRKCMKITIIFTMVINIVILVLYRPISMYILERESILIIGLLAVHLLGSVILKFAMLEVRMRQNAKLYSLLNVLIKLLYLLFVVIFYLKFKNDSKTLIMAIVISNVFVILIALYIEREELYKKSSRNKLKTSSVELIKYGIPFMFSMAVTWVFQSIDRVSIRQFCGYSEVGLYSGAMNIIALLNAFQSAFTTFWVPVAYERYLKNPRDKNFFTNANKIVAVLMMFAAIALIGGKDIIGFLLGKEYREAIFIFPYLVFMPIMYTISETTVLGINFKKKTRNHIIIAICSALFNIIGNIILVPIYGARGAAISTGLAYIVFFILRTYISNKHYKVNYNLGKFSLSIVMIYILATYSSFYKFNIIILILIIVSVIVVTVLYLDVFKTGVRVLMKKINKQ